ncbi:Hypothetical protein, putative [Bodo saltans]|uniref:Regulator of chromosome condensation n=1 Tax=Bodo saltans TaxID=75058 RepID=A0A0S4JFJ7_BODSA|nr:Hypothetical protein, putative [Bodo saltans]|eukprot:CUG88814.1 Hypothetical protein, putative [Bodo saltans]
MRKQCASAYHLRREFNDRCMRHNKPRRHVLPPDDRRGAQERRKQRKRLLRPRRAAPEEARDRYRRHRERRWSPSPSTRCFFSPAGPTQPFARWVHCGGGCHAATSHGRIFGWGNNTYGQLGLGAGGVCEVVSSHRLIPFPLSTANNDGSLRSIVVT